jgi:hypothetical protein
MADPSQITRFSQIIPVTNRGRQASRANAEFDEVKNVSTGTSMFYCMLCPCNLVNGVYSRAKALEAAMGTLPLLLLI